MGSYSLVSLLYELHRLLNEEPNFVRIELIFFRKGGIPRLLHRGDAHIRLLKHPEYRVQVQYSMTNHGSLRIDTKINQRRIELIKLLLFRVSWVYYHAGQVANRVIQLVTSLIYC